MRTPALYDDLLLEVPIRKRKRNTKNWHFEETFSYEPVRAQRRYNDFDDELKQARRRKRNRKRYLAHVE